MATGCCRAGRPRPRRGSRTPGSPTSSATSSTTFCRSCRRSSGARSRSRCSSASRRRSVDERAVAAAFLAALRLLAADRPLCLAVDDLQWLDAAVARSAPLRAGAPRRRAGRRARSRCAATPPPWLRRSVPETRLDDGRGRAGSASARMHELLQHAARRVVPATDAAPALGDVGREPVLRARAGRRAPSDAAARSPRATRSRSPRPGRAPARAPRRPRRGLPSRSRGSSPRSPSRPPTSSRQLLGARAEAGLVEALDARILELDGERLRFTHPLLGSAVVARQTPSRRRSLHARLAEVVPTAEERARHLALATAEPRPRDRLDPRGGGAVGAAPAARRRPPPSSRSRRSGSRRPATPTDARRRRLPRRRPGTTPRATPAARSTLLARRASDGRARAPSAASVLAPARRRAVEDEPREARARSTAEALVEAEGDDALEATDPPQAREPDALRGRASSGASAHATRPSGPPRGPTTSRSGAARSRRQADWRFRAGRGVPRAEMDEALALERTLPGWPLAGGPAERLCHQLVWAVDARRAHGRLLLELLDGAPGAERPRERGDRRSGTWACSSGGRGTGTRRTGTRPSAVELRTQLGRVSPHDELPGRDRRRPPGPDRRRARAVAAEPSPGRDARGDRGSSESGHSWVLGFIELSLGDAASALPHLRRSYELRNTFMLEPGACASSWATCSRRWSRSASSTRRRRSSPRGSRVRPRSTGPGRSRSSPAAAALAARGARRPRRRASRASSARSPSTTARRPVPARADAARARSDPAPREEARRRPRDARGRARSLRGARRAALGRADARRARAHRRPRSVARRADRGRAPRSPSSSPRVGTNRQVAAALFLTEHSVETALTRVYRKLGVRSRRELTRQLAGDGLTAMRPSALR